MFDIALAVIWPRQKKALGRLALIEIAVLRSLTALAKLRRLDIGPRAPDIGQRKILPQADSSAKPRRASVHCFWSIFTPPREANAFGLLGSSSMAWLMSASAPSKLPLRWRRSRATAGRAQISD